MSYEGWEDWESGRCGECPGNMNHLQKHAVCSQWGNPWLFGKSFSDKAFSGSPAPAGAAGSGQRSQDGFVDLARLRRLRWLRGLRPVGRLRRR